jgi:drug/metabolite transporter (DMT)-like permease
MNRAAWLLFGALSIIWGMPYLFIKIALPDLSPAWIAFARVAVGAITLVGFVPRAHWQLVRPHWAAISVVALTDIALPFLLIANGERYVSSAFTGLLLSAIPIVTALLALLLDRQDRLTRPQIVGLCVGIAGVAAMVGLDLGHDPRVVFGTLLVAGATLSYSVGVLLIKRWLGALPTFAATAAMLVVAALILAPAALLHPPAHPPGVPTVVAIVVLGAVCTAIAYIFYFALVARIGATRASVVTYVNPIFAIVLGVMLLGEVPTYGMIAGLLLVLVGSWLSISGRAVAKVQRASPPAAC